MRIFLKKMAVLSAVAALVLAALTGCPNPASGGGSTDKTVDIAAVTGITAPVTGAAPAAAVTETDQFTGTVAWEPEIAEGGTFAAETAYTATITLTAKKGFTFKGVAKDFFTVAGASAVNETNSGVISAVFPATGKTAPDPNPDPVAVTGVSLSKSSVTIPVGGSEQLTATIEPANATNKNVTWSTSDNTAATVDEHGKVSGVKGGVATITVTTADGSFTATCEAHVREVSGIAVKTQPTKAVYIAGDEFNPAGLVITVTYSAGEPASEDVEYAEDNKDSFTFTGFDSATTGAQTVTVAYGGKTASITGISVKGVQSIAVKTQPAKKAYAVGEAFNPAGLVITVTYTDDTSEDVSYGTDNAAQFSFGPADWNATAGANKSLTVTYGGKSATGGITGITVKEVSGIAVKTQPTKKEYAVGEAFNAAGLVITVTYTDSTSEDVSYGAANASQFSFGPADWNATAGTGKTVTVTYGGKSATGGITGITILQKYTVSFNSTGGSAVTSQTVTSGGTATRPANPTKANATFDNWYSDAALTAVYNFSQAVTANITLYAKWTPVSGNTLAAGFYAKANPTGADTPIEFDATYDAQPNIIAKAKAYIDADDSGAREYTLVLGADIDNVAAITLNKADTVLTITSLGNDEVKISKGTENGRLFTVGGTDAATASNAKLIIDGHVTLQGKDANTDALVYVGYKGRLDLQGYAKVTGNTSDGSGTANGGGVYALGNSSNRVTLALKDNAEISGNAISKSTGNAYGGGLVFSFADFTMSGSAKISGNTAESATYAYAGGVYLGNTTFTMSGSAKIINNTAKGATGYGYGGGIRIDTNGAFTMEGGEISGNTAEGATYVLGGGVYMNGTTPVFSFRGGVIKDNILKYKQYGAGGGVYVGAGTYVMSGAAEVTPKSDGGISPDITGITNNTSEVKTDTRNSIGLAETYYLGVYDTLSAANAGIIDLNSAWAASSSPVIRRAASATGSISDFNAANPAPTGKFTLGKFIASSSPYAVTDITVTKQWSAGGTGALADFVQHPGGQLYAGSAPGDTPINLAGQSGTNVIAQAASYIAALTDEQAAAAPAYTLVLSADIANVAAITLNKANTTLTITSDGDTERVISKGTASGRLFTVGGTSTATASNAKLIIDGHITLQGKDANTDALVYVGYRGQLDLQGYAKVTGNTSSANAGGVYATSSLGNSVTLTLKDNAEISGNTLSRSSSGNGGGAHLEYAYFTMSGNAKISNNICKGTSNSVSGGGVYINTGGSFTMEGGEISGNTVDGATYVQGGGVFSGSPSIYFKGGVIKDNILKYKTYGQGGGVYVGGGSFVMSGAAQVTPKEGGGISGTYDGTTVITDTRNSIYLGSTSYPVAVYGTLTAGTAGLIDLPSTWAAQKLLRSASSATGGTISDFTSSAPTDKFTLGKFITIASPYDVEDISDSRQWNDDGALQSNE